MNTSLDPKESPQWWRITAFVIVACFFAILLACVVVWDFLRWLLSGIWPVETRHPEKPGSRNILS